MRSFTLVELVVVIVILGVLLVIAAPNYSKTRESALGKEAIVNLGLIQAAEKVYRMEAGTYYPASGTVQDISSINSNLKLSIVSTNWTYAITGGASTFTAGAYRVGGGGYLDCEYSMTESQAKPTGNSSCP